jgi:hypothetical protein
MRRFLTCVFARMILSIVASGADTGVPPRVASTDYPVHGKCGRYNDRGCYRAGGPG